MLELAPKMLSSNTNPFIAETAGSRQLYLENGCASALGIRKIVILGPSHSDDSNTVIHLDAAQNVQSENSFNEPAIDLGQIVASEIFTVGNLELLDEVDEDQALPSTSAGWPLTPPVRNHEVPSQEDILIPSATLAQVCDKLQCLLPPPRTKCLIPFCKLVGFKRTLWNANHAKRKNAIHEKLQIQPTTTMSNQTTISFFLRFVIRLISSC